uniref:ANK_REP_REGION domain-containing protein n=1 Tax=Ascaris lumbricoides TaxID=6252 RepID=A0A0M3IJ51_ASCLU
MDERQFFGLQVMEAQPLHYATITEDIPHERSEAILHILLKNGASVNGKDIDGRTAILWAASNGNTDAMLSLIQAGGDRLAVDRDRLSALHCAASHGHEHVLELLIESSDKLIIDAVDRNGDTPLFYAVTLGHFECARLLLLSGANANHQDFRLRTAAHCAAAKGQLRMLKVLKHFGASFEIQNRRGDIPLHEAIQAGSKDIVEWLLALHPSTVNSANHAGRTGLHLAAASGNMEIVVMLCSKSAEINPLMLYKGALYTPLDLAKKKEHELIVEYLTRRHAAKTADQIPEESRKDWMARLEEQIDHAHKQANYRQNYVEEFDRCFGSIRKISRQRSQGENLSTQETQTAQPDCKPAATNTSRNVSRRPSSASPRTIISSLIPKATSTTDLLSSPGGTTINDTQRNASRRPSSASPRTIISSLIPKATSTTDLLSSPGGTTINDTQADREAVDQRIQRIVQEEIQKAALAINEESRRRSAEEAETSVTQSTSEAESIIVSPIEKNSMTTKKKKKSIRPTKSASKKTMKNTETPEVSDDEVELRASTTRHSDDSKNDLGLTIPSDDQPNRSFEVVYSSAEDSAEDSLASEEFRKKTRRALRDTSGVAQYRDVFAGSVGKRSMKESRGKMIDQRYLHEKAIFEELTHLKKVQIQYGKANERFLVRSLIGNFCKMHELNPAHFKFQTFYTWEKFLYGKMIDQRYLHEKAIFEELTHLKKVQIQYGKANERFLVRSLIGNFCKMHELNPAHFKFQTFYTWEKFLYDQLKLIYMEERQRLKNTRPLPNTR